MAKSCISPWECAALLKTNRPTATLPASKRVMNGGHRTWRHEGSRAIDVADGFRHGLAHVGVRVEHQLHQCRALDTLAFHVIDAGDVEEVILVVVSEIAFHLRRIHAAVRLRDVDGRIADLRKDIDRHALAPPEWRTARWRRGPPTTVSGRLRAARTRRMLRANLRHERPDVSGSRGHRQQPAPDSQAGQRIVDFGLREQALRLGHFVDIPEARICSER